MNEGYRSYLRRQACLPSMNLPRVPVQSSSAMRTQATKLNHSLDTIWYEEMLKNSQKRTRHWLYWSKFLLSEEGRLKKKKLTAFTAQQWYQEKRVGYLQKLTLKLFHTLKYKPGTYKPAFLSQKGIVSFFGWSPNLSNRKEELKHEVLTVERKALISKKIK